MISQEAAIAVLRKELKGWRSKSQSDFVMGFMQGLLFCISTLRELGRYTNERMKDNPHYVALLFRRGK